MAEPSGFRQVVLGGGFADLFAARVLGGAPVQARRNWLLTPVGRMPPKPDRRSRVLEGDLPPKQ